MTDTGLVLSLFTALAVLAVGSIVAAALWARARSAAQDRLEPAYEAANGDTSVGWLGQDDETH